MIINKYTTELEKLKSEFDEYEQTIDTIILNTKNNTDHTVITKGRIHNYTPFHEERLGGKLKGRIIPSPVISNDCIRYHYDSKGRIIMVEVFSVFLNKFLITEIFLYHDRDEFELLWFSSEILSSLSKIYFKNEKCYLKLSTTTSGNSAQEYIYNGELLEAINLGYTDGDYKDEFTYKDNTLIMIERIYPNGYKRVLYTTKKPNFNKLREAVYQQLKEEIVNYKNDFKCLGIEGFLDQQNPDFSICFETSDNPNDSIADWNSEMITIPVYDFHFSDEQLNKCMKIMAEIIVELVNEGILENKVIYFHQNQVPVTEYYPRVKSIFKKAGLIVR